MITPVHIGFKTIVYATILSTGFFNLEIWDFILLISAELIDLDHLASKPIYHPRRNPFKTHIIHKNWRIVLIIAFIFLFIRPVMFLGIGLISHLFMDWLYIKRYKL